MGGMVRTGGVVGVAGVYVGGGGGKLNSVGRV
jgi:hypothetical protein